MVEIWKPIIGFEGFYEVSSLGRVKNTRRRTATYAGRILKPGSHGKKSYPQVNLWVRGKCKHSLIHLLVANAFIGPRPTSLHECNHKDGNKENNHASNLEWVTRSENAIHACWVLGKRIGDDHYSRRNAA